MAVITSLTTLNTAIADYLARDDLTSYISNFIQNCENKVGRTLNLRNEETALSVAISSGLATVPADFKALKFAYYSATPVQLLQWLPLEDIYRKYPNRSDTSTVPGYISREAASFIFGPVAADGTLKGVYYAKQDPLRTTNPSWYVTNAPEVLLYGSLLEAAPFMHGDERIPVWQQLFKDALDTLREEEKNSATSKGQLIQRAS